MTLFQLNQDELDEIIENPEEFFEINYLEEKYNSIDIDKSWDGLKFLLSKVDTNNSIRLSKLISSEQEIEGFEELEVTDIYNVNFLTLEQVKILTRELNNITENELKEKFDFKTMNEIDLNGNPFDDKSFSYFVEYFEKLKQFYQIASSGKKSVISFVS